MTTLGDLIASVHTSLHSYTGMQERVTWLTGGIDASVTSIAVGSTDAAIKGITEVDSELLYVDSADAGVLTLTPFGRGYRGSTAATHSANAEVTIDPAFPKVEIRRAIEQCIAGLYPTLYQVKTTDINFEVMPVGYDLPADCEKVLEVKASLSTDPYNYNMPIYHWSFDAHSPEATGRSLNLYQNLQPGSVMRVVYMAKFGTFASDAATLASVGLDDSMADLILYCVTARMIRFLDPSRLQGMSVENLSRASVVNAGDAGRVANQLYAMYQTRLQEERRKVLDLTPAQIHFTR